jgi:hypothetical protein
MRGITFTNVDGLIIKKVFVTGKHENKCLENDVCKYSADVV